MLLDTTDLLVLLVHHGSSASLSGCVAAGLGRVALADLLVLFLYVVVIVIVWILRAFHYLDCLLVLIYVIEVHLVLLQVILFSILLLLLLLLV